eukprot:scaffold7904_cov103-Isochrysis_galbana.AAC.4
MSTSPLPVHLPTPTSGYDSHRHPQRVGVCRRLPRGYPGAHHPHIPLGRRGRWARTGHHQGAWLVLLESHPPLLPLPTRPPTPRTQEPARVLTIGLRLA